MRVSIDTKNKEIIQILTEIHKNYRLLRSLIRLDGSIHMFMFLMSKIGLIDFGLTALDGQQCIDLVKIIEHRHGKKSTIIVYPNCQIKLEPSDPR